MSVFRLLLLMMVGMGLWCCQRQAAAPSEFARADALLGSYISSHTTGEVSRASVIRVVFTEPVIKPAQVGRIVDRKLLDVKPALSGELKWADTRTLELRPDVEPTPGVYHQASLDLTGFFDGLPQSLQTLTFGFRYRQRALRLIFGHLKSAGDADMVHQVFEGEILSTDVERAEDVEAMISASLDEREMPLTWSHDASGLSHRFVVTNIERTFRDQRLKFAWHGWKMQPGFKGERSILIPAQDAFVFLDGRVETKPGQHVVLTFSDPLADQDLTGLIRMSRAQLKFVIEGNQVRAYSERPMRGQVSLRIEPGIRNAVGARIESTNRLDLYFDEPLPEIRLAESRVICPSTEGVIFPFEAVNLSAVDVRVTRIHQNNIQQFFQINRLNTDFEQHRVGEEVLRTTVKLEAGDKDLKEWNRHVLELGKLLETEPGAIYQIQIGFRQAYSLYSGCPKVEEVGPSMWDQPYPPGSWENRNDACRPEYFHVGRSIKRNLLASDLGLIAKQDQDGGWFFVATDMTTTEPLADLSLKVYNYQQQLLQALKTDQDGMARCKPEGEPWLLVASRGKMRGYLTLNGNNLLSTSMFPVGGQELEKGLNGFIYGERGVWRPGDDIHLTFVLLDRDHLLPAQHPVQLEWVDARNRVLDRISDVKGVNGFHHVTLKTDPNAPTGYYHVRFSVGGAVFTKRIRVETILPNRLKIKLDLSEELPIQANLEAAWLHGAPAGELKAAVSVRTSAGAVKFEGYEGYEFDDPTLDFDSVTREVFKGKLDAEGKKSFPIDLNLSGQKVPAKLNLTLSCKVFEPGGAFSTDRFTVSRMPRDFYVGVRAPKTRGWYQTLNTDVDHPISVLTLDRDGKPVQRREVKVSVYKLVWRWWWHSNAWSAGDFRQNQETTLVDSVTVATDQNGFAAYNFNVPRDAWGRYLIMVEDPGGHTSGKVVFVDWPDWRGRSDSAGDGATMLSFTSDKEHYRVGERVTLNIPSGAAGRALVSLESGSRVLEAHWVEAEEGYTRFSFDVTAAMAPNIYASVTLLQPHAQTANNLPIRMYGVLPILVENPDTKIAPVLKTPEVIKPKSTFDISVSEANGQAMTYTVAMVDEGLLDLTRFKTPDPHHWFYSRQALRVRTHDLYSQVAGAFGGHLESLLAVGGGDGASASDAPKANRFEPVVRFLGPFELKPGAIDTHQVDMPNYVGSVRFMVVAGADEAFGHAEATRPVKKPLMLLGTLPRVLGPGEEVSFPVSVFATEPDLGEVTLSLETNDLLQPLDGVSRKIRLKEVGDKLVRFPLEVGNIVGIARAKVIATAGEHRAEFEVELDVRNPNPMVRDYHIAMLEPGGIYTDEFQALGSVGSNSAVLEVCGVPPLNLEGRLDYLISYPHGCVEQTTSAVFPQLYLADVVDMSAARIKQTEANIRAGINRLQSFQLANGGLSYWPGLNEVNAWGTNYAGHFLLEAQRMGYHIPGDMLQKWLNYQKGIANYWNPNYHSDSLVQAHRLYLLAVAGRAELGAMNRYRNRPNSSNVERWLLAAAYDLAGQPEAARAHIANTKTKVNAYRELSGTYGGGERDQALILLALLDMGLTSDAFQSAKNLAEALNGDQWYNTQALGYGLSALGRFNTGNGGPMSYRYSLDPKALNNVTTDKPFSNRPLVIQETQINRLVVENTGERPLYLRLMLRGQPLVDKQEGIVSGLEMNLGFFKPDGSRLDPRHLKQGQDFYLDVFVTNPGSRGNYKEMALTRVFPSGWEILNQRMDGTLSGTDAAFTYEDVRDDRVMTYYDLGVNQTKTFRVWLNAAYAGRFYFPQIVAEAMYDKEIQAVTPGFWVEVTP